MFFGQRHGRILAAVAIVLFITALLVPHPYNASHAVGFLRKPGKPNGVIFMLVSPSRLMQAARALRQAEDRFNRRLKYPYVLFTIQSELDAVGGIPEDTIRKIDWITEGRASFQNVPPEHWDVPATLDSSLVAASIKNIGFSAGYRSMCRFYSGFFWRHPALAKYDWLWRLDTDIEFHCDIPYDPIERLISHNALYGFLQVNPDADWVQPSLAANVSHFMKENKHLFPADANHLFSWKGAQGVEKALDGRGGNHEWTGNSMYNNFEISHRSVWESELYTTFFEYLDATGGFFYERWGDAPIHSYGLSMLLRPDQALALNGTGYQHQGWAYECPETLETCTCQRTQDIQNFNTEVDRWSHPK